MSEKTPCPSCGAPASGNFCSSCGAALGGRHCTQCGASLVPGARFCNECGAPVGASPEPPAAKQAGGGSSKAAAGPSGGAKPARASRAGAQAAESRGSSTLGWWAAGAMMVLVITIFALPILRPEEPAPPPGGGSAAGVAPATTDISNMTPMEAANRLYNRVMQAASDNDDAQVQQFLPMAISAHEMARPLTADAAFHLSSLQRMALQNEDALATAREALAEDPDHLLLLYSGGEAARALGQEEVVQEFADRMLEAWDREIGSAKSEYELHSGMMSDVRAFAEANAGGGE